MTEKTTRAGNAIAAIIESDIRRWVVPEAMVSVVVRLPDSDDSALIVTAEKSEDLLRIVKQFAEKNP